MTIGAIAVIAQPLISCVICTHNRASYLGAALASLSEQDLAKSEYEVIVVDNACTDETAEVVAQWVTVLPNLRLVREDRLGLSWARNAATSIAASSLIAFLDDDARADRGWLSSLLRAFDESEPKPMAVGGRVLLNWGGPTPNWLPRTFWSLYSHLDLGEGDRVLDGKGYLVGANLAFRREALQAVGGFDPYLGRRGSTLLSGEESAVLGRIRQNGWPILYCGSALVWHSIPSIRQKRRWLVSRAYWDGASQPLLDMALVPGRPVTSGWRSVLADCRQLLRLGFRLAGDVLWRRDQAFVSLLDLSQRAGHLRTKSALALGLLR